jgi:hypothetical protein
MQGIVQVWRGHGVGGTGQRVEYRLSGVWDNPGKRVAQSVIETGSPASRIRYNFGMHRLYLFSPPKFSRKAKMSDTTQRICKAGFPYRKAGNPIFDGRFVIILKPILYGDWGTHGIKG